MNAILLQSRTEQLAFAFGYGQSWLGVVLVAAGDKGVTSILLGDDAARLRRDLVQAFPSARLVEDEAGLRDVIALVVAFLEAPGQGLDLPLDVRGTDLERAVWRALADIPAGETITYGQIAKSLPIPATAQEVGAACAANVLAVAIPCHRVVKADGGISGYRWGVHRKKRLINREALG